jgi:cytochrome c553
MTCHVRISGNGDLKTMKDADVPIMACTACHENDLTKELNSRAEKTAAFQCGYCHTAAVGAFPVPPSHQK